MIQVVLQLSTSTPAVEFNRRDPRVVHQERIAKDWCRDVINRATTRLRSIFNWAAGEGDRIPTEVHLRLTNVGRPEEGAEGRQIHGERAAGTRRTSWLRRWPS